MAIGCTTGIYDGQRVSSRSSTLKPAGYVTQPYAAGDYMQLQAFNPGTAGWDVIKSGGTISSSVSWTLADGTDLYSWSLGSTVVPNAYWQAGTGGYFTRLRVRWIKGSTTYNTLMSRGDALECFFEDYDGQGNTLAYIMDNCFSHRGEAYIYTSGYRQGPWWCGAPSAATPKTQDHYMMNQLPACAQDIAYDQMTGHISRESILDHYEINHNNSGVAHENETVVDDGTCSIQSGADGMCELGGFFAGHERYLRKMERHVMVYDYPWMPDGKIPSWDPSTPVPVPFQTAVASPNGDCLSYTCSGWRSGNVANANPGVGTPFSIQPANVCGHLTVSSLHGATNGWHGGVHGALGGAFGTFDSPSFPLFYAWHNYVNDIWLNWKDCGHPIP